MKFKSKILFVFAVLFASNAMADKTIYKCYNSSKNQFYDYDVMPVTDSKNIKCWHISKPDASETKEDKFNADKIRAAEMLKNGEFDKAYPEYIKLFKQSPLDNNVLFGLAVVSEKSGHNNQAIMAYEMLQERYPDDNGVKEGMARNYEILGDHASAESIMGRTPPEEPKKEEEHEEVEEVKEQPKVEEVKEAAKPETKIEKKTEPAQTKVEKPKQPIKTFYLSGNVNSGIMYDSNANSGPADGSMHLGNWNVSIPDAVAKDTSAFYMGGAINVAKKIYGGFFLIGEGSANIRENENSNLDDSHTRASHYLRGAAGLRYVGSKSITDVKVKTEVLDYQLWQRMYSSGLELSYLYAANSNLYLGANIVRDYKDFDKTPDHNVEHNSAGGIVRYFMDDKRYALTVRAAFNSDATKGWHFNYRDYSSDGYEAGINLSIKTVQNYEFVPFVQLARDFYRSPATILETDKRHDTRFTTGLNINYNITKSWLINGAYSYTGNDSNSALYKFDKHLIQLGTSYVF